MGKISVTGTAEREIEADVVEMKISFLANDDSSAKASKKVNEQCENFLKNLNDMGFDMKSVRMVDENIARMYRDNGLIISAKKVIAVKFKLDLSVVNSILSIIQDNQYDIDYSVSYQISNLQVIHEELLKEAVNDSRKKAEIIAKTTHQKIVGIDTVNMNDFAILKASGFDCMAAFQTRASKTPLSDNLEAPKQTESENIDVVWLII